MKTRNRNPVPVTCGGKLIHSDVLRASRHPGQIIGRCDVLSAYVRERVVCRDVIQAAVEEGLSLQTMVRILIDEFSDVEFVVNFGRYEGRNRLAISGCPNRS